ncbi:hypothetical protein JKP88DRAFT_326650, partial [Tribonema minus]
GHSPAAVASLPTRYLLAAAARGRSGRTDSGSAQGRSGSRAPPPRSLDSAAAATTVAQGCARCRRGGTTAATRPRRCNYIRARTTHAQGHSAMRSRSALLCAALALAAPRRAAAQAAAAVAAGEMRFNIASLGNATGHSVALAGGAEPDGAPIAAWREYVFAATPSSKAGYCPPAERPAHIRVFNVTDKARPQFVKALAGPMPPLTRTTHIDVQAVGGHVLMVTATDVCSDYQCTPRQANEIVGYCEARGVEVWDVSDMSNPKHVGQIKKEQGLRNLPVTGLSLFELRGQAFVAVAAGWHPQVGPVFGGLQIFNLNNPAKPFPDGHWGLEQELSPGTRFERIGADDDLFTPMLMALGGAAAAGGKDIGAAGSTRGVAVAAGAGAGGAPLAYVAQGAYGLIALDLSGAGRTRGVRMVSERVTRHTEYAVTSTEGVALLRGAHAPAAAAGGVGRGAAAPPQPAVLELRGAVATWTETLLYRDDISGNLVPLQMAARRAAVGDRPAFVTGNVTQGVVTWVGDACSPYGLTRRSDALEGFANIAAVARNGMCPLRTKAGSARSANYKALIEFDLLIDQGAPTDIMAAATDPAIDVPVMAVSYTDSKKIMGDNFVKVKDNVGVNPNTPTRTQVDGRTVQLIQESSFWTLGSLEVWDAASARGATLPTSSPYGTYYAACGGARVSLAGSASTLSLTEQDNSDCAAPPPRRAPLAAALAFDRRNGHTVALVSFGAGGVAALDVTTPSAPAVGDVWPHAADAAAAPGGAAVEAALRSGGGGRVVALARTDHADRPTFAAMSETGTLYILEATWGDAPPAPVETPAATPAPTRDAAAGGGGGADGNVGGADNGGSASGSGGGSSGGGTSPAAAALITVFVLAAVGFAGVFLVRRYQRARRLQRLDEEAEEEMAMALPPDQAALSMHRFSMHSLDAGGASAGMRPYDSSSVNLL